MKIWYRVILAAVVVPLISVAGIRAPVAGKTVSAQDGEGPRYSYICDAPIQVQEVGEYPGYEVVIVDSVERPDSASGMFEVFQASRPEKYATMAASLGGPVPGNLLVAVTWAAPHLNLVKLNTAGPHGGCSGTKDDISLLLGVANGKAFTPRCLEASAQSTCRPSREPEPRLQMV